jgi:hypothetical protein
MGCYPINDLLLFFVQAWLIGGECSSICHYNERGVGKNPDHIKPLKKYVDG